MSFKQWVDRQQQTTWKRRLLTEVINEAVEEAFVMVLVVNLIIMMLAGG